MTKKIPKTNRECYALLDEMLSEEDKQAIVKMEDVYEFHFTLGLWIRNNWIYPQSSEETEELLNTFSKKPQLYHPDDYSSIILESYKRHLKRRMRKTQG